MGRQSGVLLCKELLLCFFLSLISFLLCVCCTINSHRGSGRRSHSRNAAKRRAEPVTDPRSAFFFKDIKVVLNNELQGSLFLPATVATCDVTHILFKFESCKILNHMKSA